MTEANGPWMIMATTFSGEGAEDQARELVLELRKRYKLEAYTHEMKFDFSDNVAGRGVDRYGQPIRMQYRRSGEFQEIAVLVGNYISVEDREAQRTLQKIKYMVPQTLDPEGRGQTTQALAALRKIQVALLPDDDPRKEQGPMRKAFITRNPLLPRDYFVPQGLDPLVVEMNKGVKHNLLDSGAKYTVKVATFTGTVVLDQKKVQEYEESGSRLQSKLDEAAENAHRLTLALRQKGYDAFEFHDRYASIVTVGAFENVGKPRLDGKTEINPNIHAIMRAFAATPISAPATTPAAAGQTGYKPKVVIGIPCDIQPQIVQVPQPSLSAAYAR
ncbi:MAG: hypothetical protein KDA42_09340 [Planctomycetales bacterium]|nr:hypothetical protein [Planctomycetales bacterium]